MGLRLIPPTSDQWKIGDIRIVTCSLAQIPVLYPGWQIADGSNGTINALGRMLAGAGSNDSELIVTTVGAAQGTTGGAVQMNANVGFSASGGSAYAFDTTTPQSEPINWINPCVGVYFIQKVR